MMDDAYMAQASVRIDETAEKSAGVDDHIGGGLRELAREVEWLEQGIDGLLDRLDPVLRAVDATDPSDPGIAAISSDSSVRLDLRARIADVRRLQRKVASLHERVDL